MAEVQPRRLPGVRFEVPPPDLDAALPRMDIAFFLGFATRGPLERAVAVESLAEFEAVYGTGIVLARRKDSEEPVLGQLHPCVRAFFSQGGQRCWILRVAGAQAAASRFPVPSMLLAQRTGSGHRWRLRAASVSATSPGSGFDALRLAARVEARVLRARALALNRNGAVLLRLSRLAAEGLQPGDAVRATHDGTTLQGRIAAISPERAEVRVEVEAFTGLRALRSGEALPALHVLGPDGSSRGLAVLQARWQGADRLQLRCALTGAMPQPGEVLQLLRSRSPFAWMNLERVELLEPAAPGATSRVPAQIECTGSAWRRAPVKALLRSWVRPVGEQLVEVVRVQLQAREGSDTAQLSPLLRLACGSERAGSVFGLADARAFPLAAEAANGDAMWLPLTDLADFGDALGPVTSALAPQVRDGVAQFSWRLFAEGALAQETSDTLADTAERLRLAGAHLRPLHGVHALFGGAGDALLDEPTLLAIPDAVHAGWQAVTPPPLWTHDAPLPAEPPDAHAGPFLDCDATPLEAPSLQAVEQAGEGSFTLFWTQSAAGANYRIEESADAAFGIASLLYEGPAARFTVTGKPPRVFHYRVRADLGRRRSGWSVPIAVQLARTGYETVAADPEDLLALHRLMLRCAAARGDLLAVLAVPEEFDAAAAAAHAAALRDPALRGADDAPPPIGEGELRALSHGALYHPWLLIRRVDEEIRFTPEGALCGQLAAGALRRGAWIAVAERALRDVVALTPAVLATPTTAQRQALLEAQVNLVRNAPHGFVASSADTLTPDPAWRPVNVRRLMCLLRRLALRRGTEYVFEPNGATLRRTVERGFEAALDQLFRRGAFAGTKAEDAYRVEAGDDVNTPQRRDAGQFWVQLKVAPALPLSFLTVRLVREGERVVSRELH